MKGIHPNAVFAVFALFTALIGGCTQKQMAGVPNPFLAPDRVPPPSTRAIAPGTAQPYYPGDPLPVMQSATPAAADPAVSGAVSAARVDEPQKIVFSNEPSVAVPGDESPLRFELPDPPEPEPAPVAATAPPQVASSGPTAINPATLPAVIPAVYTAPPFGSSPMTGVVTAASVTEPAASGPWRSPQIVSSGPLAAYAPSMQPNLSPVGAQPAAIPSYVTAPPFLPASPSMDVSLRAISSPAPPTPLESTTPRIRLPGYPAPPDSMTPVSTSRLGASADGFRPRSSMR